MSKIIYLISPDKIYNNFYEDLNNVLKTNKVRFFQLRLKKNSKKEISSFLTVGNSNHLPYETNEFDLVISLNTLHNLYCYDLKSSLKEIERVGKKNKYICVESYRNEYERINLLYWQVTCECFFTPEEWKWWFKESSYKGDYSFIYFE